MSAEYELKMLEVLEEDPVVVHSIEITPSGINLSFIDLDEMAVNIEKANSWFFVVDDESKLSAYRLIQEICRDLISEARVAERDAQPPVG